MIWASDSSNSGHGSFRSVPRSPRIGKSPVMPSTSEATPESRLCQDGLDRVGAEACKTLFVIVAWKLPDQSSEGGGSWVVNNWPVCRDH